MNKVRWVIVIGALLIGGSAVAQLPNDTLYIAKVSGSPGQQVVVPIYIRNSVAYQGWQIPIRFGDGDSPVYCDSVSEIGSCMENWDWKSYFVNNNDWGNTQAFGAAGVVDFQHQEVLEPGYWLVATIYFTINPNAPPQTITVDTTTTNWYSGGPMLDYVVVVNDQSLKTSVVSGAITIKSIRVFEQGPDISSVWQVSPSIIRSGQGVNIDYQGRTRGSVAISVLDGSGRMVDRIYQGCPNGQRLTLSYQPGSLPRGVYFITLTTRQGVKTRKILVQ